MDPQGDPTAGRDGGEQATRRPVPLDTRRNSPLVIVAVLGTVLGIVLVIATAGRGGVLVQGTAVAALDAVRTPEAAPPRAPASTSPKAVPDAAAPGGTGQPRPVLALEDHPMLAPGVGLPQVTCRLPKLGRSPDQLRGYYLAGIKCLDDAWSGVLTGRNHPFSPPGLEIADDVATGCGPMPGEDEMIAFYCGVDHTIYMPRTRMLSQAGLNQVTHLGVLAHEYGHHVQMLSGIMMTAEMRGAKYDDSSPQALELSRRLELQANCFAGLFLASVAGRGSVRWSLANGAVADFGNTTGADTHGSVRHQLGWAETGYRGAGTAACNTWTAAPAEVN